MWGLVTVTQPSSGRRVKGMGKVKVSFAAASFSLHWILTVHAHISSEFLWIICPEITHENECIISLLRNAQLASVSAMSLFLKSSFTKKLTQTQTGKHIICIYYRFRIIKHHYRYGKKMLI